MAAKLNGELKALQERVTELEKQLQDLRAAVAASRPRPPFLNEPWTAEDARAFHESSQRVQKIIEKIREADRRRAAAEYDRLHGRPKKSPPAKQKPDKARRAG
jgi:hypothetical protein